MASTETLTQTAGTAIASPETETIKWVTMEEAEKYERMISKNYIRRDSKTGEPDKKDSKLYFYTITGMHPYVPTIIGEKAFSTDEHLFKFEVQKYYRNKYETVTTRDQRNPDSTLELKRNLPVDQHVMKNGHWILADPYASFFMDTREFVKQFMPDNIE